jgi:ubiquitin-like modifier-activating enzyme ATG7
MIEPGFWHKLSENKLNVYGLDDKAQQIKGFYFNGRPILKQFHYDYLF